MAKMLSQSDWISKKPYKQLSSSKLFR